MKVKKLIELLNKCDPDSDVEIDFTHTNHNTYIVPNNVRYTSVNDKVVVVRDNPAAGFHSVTIWGGD